VSRGSSKFAKTAVFSALQSKAARRGSQTRAPKQSEAILGTPDLAFSKGWPDFAMDMTRCFAVAFCLVLMAGCCTTSKPLPPPSAHRFDPARDTFAFRNELKWEYHFDPDGKWRGKKRDPAPDYSLHCFVLARSAKQFFLNARFNPAAPRTNENAYRDLVHRVVKSNSRHDLPPEKEIEIPGYGSLREFSRDHEMLLKSECGGAWQSYAQRGHWRMIFPFSRSRQACDAAQLRQSVDRYGIAVAHVVSFPALSINHAVVVHAWREEGDHIIFDVYDPNEPDKPTSLTFDQIRRVFEFPANDYFHGGPVDVYEVYSSALY
jgi:hypothetical protein